MVDTVTTDYSVDLRLVADMVEVPVQEISDLNPSLLRMTTPTDAPFELHLPAGTKRSLRKAHLPRFPRTSGLNGVSTKSFRENRSTTIARDYHVSPSEIVFVNQFAPGDDLSSTESLIIPVPPAPSSR